MAPADRISPACDEQVVVDSGKAFVSARRHHFVALNGAIRTGLCLALGIMGMLTPHATGPSPVYCGSGYLPAKDCWILGGVFGLIFITAFLLVGLPWMAMIR